MTQSLPGLRFAELTVATPRYARRAWLDAARVLGAFGSLTAAFWAATYFAVGRGFFVLFLALGLVLFAALMIALGRDVASRWIEFGAALGFTPGSRRAFLDFGTDRPVLHGNAGRHSARLRLIHPANNGRREEWLQAEVDLLRDATPELERRARSRGARLVGGRLVMRDRFLGFDAAHTRAFLAQVGATADALVDDG